MASESISGRFGYAIIIMKLTSSTPMTATPVSKPNRLRASFTGAGSAEGRGPRGVSPFGVGEFMREEKS